MCGISRDNHEYNKSHETDCDNECGESHKTQPTFLCVLIVLLLRFMNLDVRFLLIVDGNTEYVTSLQLVCNCSIQSCNCL